ncbi:hypothetical protein HY404_03625 [Candidatus Microgenomates bacterium]|nr:hypothetical protein [Candidatus Microgenomates bacterium]
MEDPVEISKEREPEQTKIHLNEKFNPFQMEIIPYKKESHYIGHGLPIDLYYWERQEAEKVYPSKEVNFTLSINGLPDLHLKAAVTVRPDIEDKPDNPLNFFVEGKANNLHDKELVERAHEKTAMLHVPAFYKFKPEVLPIMERLRCKATFPDGTTNELPYSKSGLYSEGILSFSLFSLSLEEGKDEIIKGIQLEFSIAPEEPSSTPNQ